jgi:hypothetical protein
MEIIRAPADIQFVTSDHPSVFTTCRNSSSSSSGALHLILLPIAHSDDFGQPIRNYRTAIR